jgi:hypothetical protein
MPKPIHFAVAIVLGAISPLPVLAQDSQTAAEPAILGAHAQLYEAMNAGVDQNTMLESQLRSVRAVWEADANLVVAERRFPGLMDAMIDAARPILQRIGLEYQAEFRPKMIAAIKTVLSDEEALVAKEFYLSPIGRKLLGGVATHSDTRRSIEGYLDNDEIDEQDVRGDIRATAGKAVAQLTDDELAALARMALEKPALMKLQALGEAIIPVRMEMERAALTSGLQAEMEAAVEAAAKRHVAGE